MYCAVDQSFIDSVELTKRLCENVVIRVIHAAMSIRIIGGDNNNLVNLYLKSIAEILNILENYVCSNEKVTQICDDYNCDSNLPSQVQEYLKGIFKSIEYFYSKGPFGCKSRDRRLGLPLGYAEEFKEYCKLAITSIIDNKPKYYAKLNKENALCNLIESVNDVICEKLHEFCNTLDKDISDEAKKVITTKLNAACYTDFDEDEPDENTAECKKMRTFSE